MIEIKIFILTIVLIAVLLAHIQNNSYNEEAILSKSVLKRKFRRAVCPDSEMCLSQHDYCGVTKEYCGEGCKGGPCFNKKKDEDNRKKSKDSKNIINEDRFRCVFNKLDDAKRRERFRGLQNSSYKPQNTEEAAVFLAHVHHETHGLKTLVEYCAPNCSSHYKKSWCNIQAVRGKTYHGRGWLQLSYPCNYDAAGKALGLDLLHNPDLVSTRDHVAVKTAVWFFQINKVFEPARRGDFAATTKLINGPQECNNGSGAHKQKMRIDIYKQIRKCFNLGEPSINPKC